MYLDPAQQIPLVEQAVEFFVPSIRDRRVNLELRLDTDDLTKLFNRRAFNRTREAAEPDADVCFVVFDCNNFKQVNDAISHTEGDRVLCLIAAKIRRAAEVNKARAYRYGGDEFVVVCQRDKAESLRDAIERRVGSIDYGSFKVSISGCVGSTFDEADESLQARKAARKAV